MKTEKNLMSYRPNVLTTENPHNVQGNIKFLLTSLPTNLLTCKSFAFTLAEVLITLGIIGVVAAITLPTLISNHQKQVLVNQLKANYSILSQGFQKMMADEEVTRFDQTEFWNECMANTDRCQEIAKKYFNILGMENDLNSGEYFNDYDGHVYCADNYNGEYVSSDLCYLISKNNSGANEYITDKRLILSNGAFVDFVHRSSELFVSLDVNGLKSPNIGGRDYFAFTLSPVDAHMKGDIFGSFKKIMRDGWKMNY